MKRARDEEGGGVDGAAPTKREPASAAQPVKSEPVVPRQKCPYLDTVNRTYLDFDFEKVGALS